MIETAAAALHGSGAAPDRPAAVQRARPPGGDPPGGDPPGGDAAGGDRPAAPTVPLADQPPPWGACRADALAELAHSGSPRTQLVVHVDAPALACTATDAAQRAGATCELEDGPAIPSESARRLSCDAALLIAQRSPDGTIDYGRARRVVSAPLRASLERRDRHCRYPGCERRHDLHAHHITHWAHGGATDKDNLALLCRFHHRLVHEEGFTVRHSRDGTLQFSRPDRRPVPPTPTEHGAPQRSRGQPIAA